ncbi:MAG: hypothetical protein ACRC2T_17555, partial [Thermoguttaceae bacterium]
ASVFFIPVDMNTGVDASGITDADGKYSLATVTGKANSGTKPAEYKVTVTKKNVEWDGKSYIERPGQAPVKDVKVSDALPSDYSSMMATPFKATVTNDKSKNVFDFDVKSQ